MSHTVTPYRDRDPPLKIIHTATTNPADLSPFDREMVYNGLDCCVTRDVFDSTITQLNPATAATYAFSKALQGPVLEMRCRGVLVDAARKNEVIDNFHDQIDTLERQLERILFEGVGLESFNWRSHRDLAWLFYDVFAIPAIHYQGRPTCNRAAREKIALYPIAKLIIDYINTLTELGDKISVLKTAIDPDGRFRTSYNIAGTSTGRFSSSTSEFGTGGNLQNIEESLRSIFIADPGYKFAKCDAKSGESYCVGAIEWNLFGDGAYLDAVESGDVHTAVARICWPNLGWTGNLADDKAIAETPFYRHYTHRFMCKKLGHGSNYGGQPATLATQTQLPIRVVKEFQPTYFAAFPAHQRWQDWVKEQLHQTGKLISLTGRQRYFFGRRNDPATLREAIAFDPQCSLADIVNTAMLRIWRDRSAIVVMHDHDALTFMYPEHLEDTIIPQITEKLTIPISLANGRTLRIPYDVETGWNKGHWCCGERKPECKGCKREKNLDGLKTYKEHDKRKRSPTLGVLDRVVYSTNRKS